MKLVKLLILTLVNGAISQGGNFTDVVLTDERASDSKSSLSEEDGTSDISNDQNDKIIEDEEITVEETESETNKTQGKRGIYGLGFGFGHGTGYYGPSVYAPATYGVGPGHAVGGYAVGHGVNFAGFPGGVYGQVPPAVVPKYGFGYGYKLGQPISHGVVKAVTIHQEVPVAVPQPYPVHVEKKVPYPVKVPVAVPVDRPYPVHIPKPYPVTIEKHVPYPVEKPVPYPVKIPIKVPVSHPVPYPVPKPYPVPVSKPVPVPYPQPVYIKKTVPVYLKPHISSPGFSSSGGGYGYPLAGYPIKGYGHSYPPSSSGYLPPSSSGYLPPSSSGYFPPSSSGYSPPTKYHNPSQVNSATLGNFGHIGSYAENPEVISDFQQPGPGSSQNVVDDSGNNVQYPDSGNTPENYEGPNYGEETHS